MAANSKHLSSLKTTSNAVASNRPTLAPVTDANPLQRQHRPPVTTRQISGSEFFHHVTLPPPAGDQPAQTSVDVETEVASVAVSATAGRHPIIPMILSGQSTLALTAAVGCALFLLNAIVFAATFCQWRKLIRTSPPKRDTYPSQDDVSDKYQQGISVFNDDIVDQSNRCVPVGIVTSLRDGSLDRRTLCNNADLNNGGCVNRSSFNGETKKELGDYFLGDSFVEKDNHIQVVSMQLPSPPMTPVSQKFNATTYSPPSASSTDYPPRHCHHDQRSTNCTSLPRPPLDGIAAHDAVPMVELSNGKIANVTGYDVMQRRSSTIV